MLTSRPVTLFARVPFQSGAMDGTLLGVSVFTDCVATDPGIITCACLPAAMVYNRSENQPTPTNALKNIIQCLRSNTCSEYFPIVVLLLEVRHLFAGYIIYLAVAHDIYMPVNKDFARTVSLCTFLNLSNRLRGFFAIYAYR